MADFSTLIATLQATIKTNYNQKITGQILQDDLLAIVDAVNRLKQDTLEGYAFHGAPLADGDSVSVTQNTFFLVAEGEYEINGNTIEVDAAGVSVIVYDSVNDTTNWYTLFAYDTTPTANSRNAITSGAVKTALDLKADKSTTYTKTETDNLLGGKVDKVAGKGLSSNDYTDAEKAKLGALPTAAELSADLAAKQDKDTGDTAGHVAVMDGSGNSVDGGVALTDLATKAEVEAVEQEVAQIAGEAGLAEAVIDTDGVGKEQEFTFRKSGGDGGAYYRKIKGKTIVVDGQLASNDAEAVETTGRNQYNPATGKAQVIGGQTYYIGGTYTSLSQDGAVITPAGDGTFTPASTGEVDVVGGNATDTIINISDADNGLWQPYWKRTLQLGITTRKDTDGNVPFADGMKGAGTAADWADKIGGEKRMKRVDLGSLEWEERTGPNSNRYFAAMIPDIKRTGNDNSGTIMNAIDAVLPVKEGYIVYYGETGIGYQNSVNRVYAGGAAYASMTAAQFKTAMDGVMLDYELATPVPFTWAEPLNLGVKVDENGTERAIAPEGATAPSAPFVADTTYTMSVARMVEILKNL